MTSLKEEIRKICTYHGDEGTSGYCLSNEQFDELESAFLRAVERAKPRFESFVKDNPVREAVNDYYDNLRKEIQGGEKDDH